MGHSHEVGISRVLLRNLEFIFRKPQRSGKFYEVSNMSQTPYLMFTEKSRRVRMEPPKLRVVRCGGFGSVWRFGVEVTQTV